MCIEQNPSSMFQQAKMITTFMRGRYRPCRLYTEALHRISSLRFYLMLWYMGQRMLKLQSVTLLTTKSKCLQKRCVCFQAFLFYMSEFDFGNSCVLCTNLYQRAFLLLHQLGKATSLEVINNEICNMSTVLSLAGCMQHIKQVGDQNMIVENTAHWYVFGRTRSAFER